MAGDTSAEGRIWLITGASSGFGRAIAQAALKAGDTVVAAARRTDTLAELRETHPDRLVPLAMDVTDLHRDAEAVREIIDRFGRIDVLVNNAGRTMVGAVEETADEELRGLMDLHFHGPVALTRAVLPHMRERRSGTIVQLTSIGGQLSFAGFGAYSATKCALEGLSEALADEVKTFGIRVLIVEPGQFRTSLFGAGRHMTTELDAYADTVGATRNMVNTGGGTQAGDPDKAAAAILTALDAEDMPLRLPLGSDAVDSLVEHADGIRAELRAWEHVSRNTAFDDRESPKSDISSPT